MASFTRCTASASFAISSTLFCNSSENANSAIALFSNGFFFSVSSSSSSLNLFCSAALASKIIVNRSPTPSLTPEISLSTFSTSSHNVSNSFWTCCLVRSFSVIDNLVASSNSRYIFLKFSLWSILASATSLANIPATAPESR